MDTITRPATEHDLPRAATIWWVAEGGDPSRVTETMEYVPAVLPHVLRTGIFRVAERDGELVGFGSSILRGDIRFLAQLFLLPGQQSAGIGHKLLREVMPRDGLRQATIASPDFRAVALYTRYGMLPLWPVYGLAAPVANLQQLASSGVTTAAATPGEPDLIRMDTQLNGRHRPEDHRFWQEHKGGIPLWLERSGRRVGYAWLQVQQTSSDAALDCESVRVGPLGCLDPADAVECVLAAIREARQYGSRVTILVPAPHPALRPLLDLGFRISYFDTFHAGSNPPFADPHHYIPSGGGLY